MSTIKIYKTKITPDRNALVDDLSGYLTSLTPTYENSEFQYIQIEPKKTIKLNIEQEKVGKSIGNYLDIYQDNKHYYYFITKARWKAKNTVELEIGMDTINTFRSDFTFNKKTSIVRQHKDRLKWHTTTQEIDDKTIVNSFTGTVTFDVPEEFTSVDSVVLTYTIRAGSGTIVFGTPSFNVTTHKITCSYNGGGSGYIEIYITYNASVTGLIKQIDFKSEGLETPLYCKSSENIYSDVDQLDYYYYYHKVGTSASINKSVVAGESFKAKAVANDNTVLLASMNDGYYYIDFAPASDPTPQKDALLQTVTMSLNNKKFKDFIIEENPQYVPSYGELTLNESDVTSLNDVNSINTGRVNVGTFGHYAVIEIHVINHKIDSLKLVPYINKQEGSVRKYYHTTDARDEIYGPDIVAICSHTYRQTVVLNKGWDNIIAFKLACNQSFVIYYTGSNWYNSRAKIRAGAIFNTYNGTSSEIEVAPFDNIPRDDNSKDNIYKIIKLPYAPFNYSIDSNGKYLVENVTFNTDSTSNFNNTLTLDNKTDNYTQEVSSNLPDPQNVVNNKIMITPSLNDLRNDNYESKLLHGDYYQPRLSYDVAEYTYRLETLNIPDESLNNLSFNFKVGSGFTNTWIVQLNNIDFKYATGPYQNTLVVNINNEIPVYTSDYADYIKYGYKYDKQNETTANVAAGIGAGVGIASTIAGIAIAATGWGAAAGAGITAAGVSLIVGGVASTVTSVTGFVTGAINRENKMAQKMDELSRKKMDISCNNEITLAQEYTDNKLKLCLYEVSDNIKTKLADLFYYLGYVDEVQEVPNLNTRAWFNFISCNPVFNEEADTPYQEYLDDIKARYALGVTVYHKNNNTYDWNQVKENWETSLFVSTHEDDSDDMENDIIE